MPIKWFEGAKWSGGIVWRVQETYILVHQTGLADSTVAEDDDLDCVNSDDLAVIDMLVVTFSRTFFLEDMVRGKCGESARCVRLSRSRFYRGGVCEL